MADVIPPEHVDRLVKAAMNFKASGAHSPIEIIKNVRLQEGCSLSEAKEAYTIAANGESLGEYQKRVIAPLLAELEKFEREESL